MNLTGIVVYVLYFLLFKPLSVKANILYSLSIYVQVLLRPESLIPQSFLCALLSAVYEKNPVLVPSTTHLLCSTPLALFSMCSCDTSEPSAHIHPKYNLLSFCLLTITSLRLTVSCYCFMTRRSLMTDVGTVNCDCENSSLVFCSLGMT